MLSTNRYYLFFAAFTHTGSSLMAGLLTLPNGSYHRGWRGIECQCLSDVLFHNDILFDDFLFSVYDVRPLGQSVEACGVCQ